MPDLDPEFGGVLGEQAVGGDLRDAEDVGMGRVQPVGWRLGDAGKTAHRILCAKRKEPLQQTTLVHHFDAAHVQAERAGNSHWRGVLLQHEHVHAVQSQLAGEHQTGRSAAGDDHVDHETPSNIPNISACSRRRRSWGGTVAAGVKQSCLSNRTAPEASPAPPGVVLLGRNGRCRGEAVMPEQPNCPGSIARTTRCRAPGAERSLQG